MVATNSSSVLAAHRKLRPHELAVLLDGAVQQQLECQGWPDARPWKGQWLAALRARREQLEAKLARFNHQ